MIFDVLFVKIPDGVALYDSEVIAANGFCGGCMGKCCCELIGVPKLCMPVNVEIVLFAVFALVPALTTPLPPPIETIVMIGRFSIDA